MEYYMIYMKLLLCSIENDKYEGKGYYMRIEINNNDLQMGKNWKIEY